MNFINLMELIKDNIDLDIFTALHNDFSDAFAAEYQNLKPCKSSIAKAIKKYVGGAKYKDATTAIYTTGVTVLLLDKPAADAEDPHLQTTDLATPVSAMLKDRKPVDCWFFESIALYKVLKKQEKQDYFLQIDGHYYNASLVAEMIECIADNKDRYICAQICSNGALCIQQKHAAFVLPVKTNGCPVSKNVNARDFFKYVKDLDDGYTKSAIKTA